MAYYYHLANTWQKNPIILLILDLSFFFPPHYSLYPEVLQKSIQLIHRDPKNACENQRKVNVHQNTGKKCSMNNDLLKRVVRFMTPWQVKKAFQVSALSFDTEYCMPEHWFAGSLENSGCHKNHLKSILNSLFQVLDITDFCSISSRL